MIANVFDDRDEDAFPEVAEEVRTRLGISGEAPVRLVVSSECSTLVFVDLSGYPPDLLRREYRGPEALREEALRASSLRLCLGSFDDWSPEESLRKCQEALSKKKLWVTSTQYVHSGVFVAGRVDDWGKYRSAYSLIHEGCVYAPRYIVSTERLTVRIPMPDSSSLEPQLANSCVVVLRLTGENRTPVVSGCSAELQATFRDESRAVLIILGIFHRSHPDKSHSCALKALERCKERSGTNDLGMTLVPLVGAFFALERLDPPSPRAFVSGLTWNVKR